MDIDHVGYKRVHREIVIFGFDTPYFEHPLYIEIDLESDPRLVSTGSTCRQLKYLMLKYKHDVLRTSNYDTNLKWDFSPRFISHIQDLQVFSPPKVFRDRVQGPTVRLNKLNN